MRSGVRSHFVLAIAALAVALAACAGTPSASPSAAPASVFAVVGLPSATDAVPSSTAPDSDAAPSASDWPVPTASTGAGTSVATRIVIPDLGIDLAVVKSPPAGVYPYCDVAMYLPALGQPGGDRATYIFAHARTGMFGPIYELTMVKRTPKAMVGMIVEVYTSDSMMHTYRISEVLPHQLSLNGAIDARSDELWLQTSEGPHGTPGKTQLVATPVSVTAAGFAESHPKPRIVRCG